MKNPKFLEEMLGRRIALEYEQIEVSRKQRQIEINHSKRSRAFRIETIEM